MPKRAYAPTTTIAMKSQQPEYSGYRVHVQLRHLQQFGAPKDPGGKLMVPARALPEEHQPKRLTTDPEQGAKPKSAKMRKQKRTCLTCRRPFTSDWNGNRICRTCRTQSAGMSFLEGVAD
jgi:hypothetical protein